MSNEQQPDAKNWTDVRELHTSASPDAVWRAWADPEIIAQWFADKAHGKAEPGGTLVHVFEAFGFEARYEVLRSEPGKSLTLKGDFHGLPFEQEIVVESRAGKTHMRLTHSGFGPSDDPGDWGEEFEGMDSGWKIALAILQHYLENHYEHSKQSYFAMRPGSFDWNDVPALFLESDGLARWLTRSGSIPTEPGAPVRLELHDGTALTGKVLAYPGREIAITWEEIAGTLELKAFPAGPSRAVGIRAFSWSDDEAALERVSPALETAIDSLAAALQNCG